MLVTTEDKHIGAIPANATTTVKFASPEPKKSGGLLGTYLISTGCWCTTATWRDGFLILDYNPKSNEPGKTVTKNATVTYPDGTKKIFRFTATIFAS